jgi:hypothetical protein
MNAASIAAILTLSSGSTDESDDGVMQNFGIAASLFKRRFGRESLIAALEDLLETLKKED